MMDLRRATLTAGSGLCTFRLSSVPFCLSLSLQVRQDHGIGRRPQAWRWLRDVPTRPLPDAGVNTAVAAVAVVAGGGGGAVFHCMR